MSLRNKKQTTEKLQRKQNPSMKIVWKVFIFFAAFCVITVGVLWISQSIFLDDFYYAITENQMRAMAREVAAVVNEKDFVKRVEEIALRANTCVSVYETNGALIAVADVLSNCLLHNVSGDTLNIYYSAALRSPHKEFYKLAQLSNFMIRDPYNGTHVYAPADRLIYVKVISAGDRNVIVMLDSAASPVSSIVDTLQILLIIVTAILVLVALAVALAISHHISTPIAMLNRAAKELAKGNYDAVFPRGGYREICELSDTLTYAASELSKLDRLQKELIANISHDLRTPLTMIEGYSEMMRDIPGENNPENVQIIIDETKRLSNLVNDLLEVSKYQTGTLELKCESFDMDVLCREIIDRYRHLISHDGFELEYSSDGAGIVYADRQKITQVLYNYLGNAVNYTGEDKKIFVALIHDGKNIRVEVTDTGEGIEPEKLPYVWDRYYKIDKHHKRSTVGTGLGLSIVKSIMSLHDCRYGVRSALGKGSTFWIELPTERGDSNKRGN